MARVTIGIAAYNCGCTIRDAVNSAVMQDYHDTEIIIVDDGSCDGTYDEIKSYISNNDVENIKLIKNQVNQGCASVRNQLVQEASGEYIAFFDADDISDPTRLSVQVGRIEAYAKTHPSALVLCYASSTKLYPNGYMVNNTAIGSVGEAVVGLAIVDYLLFNRKLPQLCYGAGTPTCSLLARVADIKSIGGFSEELQRQEDAELAIRFGLNGGVCIGCREFLVSQRATHSSYKSHFRELESYKKILELHSNYINEIGEDKNYYSQWASMRYYYFSKNYFFAIKVLYFLIFMKPKKTFFWILTSAVRRVLHEFKSGQLR